MVFTFIKQIYNSIFSNNIIEKKHDIVRDKYTETIPQYKQKTQNKSSISNHNTGVVSIYNYWIY